MATTSAAVAGMATAAGRWSTARFQAWRASSQSVSPGALTRPAMRSRSWVGSMPGGSVMSTPPYSGPLPASASGTSLVSLCEVRDRLLRLGGGEEVDARLGLARHRLGQQVAEAVVEHPLGARDGGPGRAVEGGDPLRDPGIEVVDDVVAEAVAVHPAGVLEVAGEEQLARGALAEHLGEQERAGVGGAKADPHLRGGEARAAGDDAEVARGGELERAADADAVDGGDDRHGRLEHDLGQALELVDGGGERLLVGVCGLEEVVAGREVRARAANDDAADVGVAGGGLDRVGDRLDRRAAPGVAMALVVPADDAGGAEYLSADVHEPSGWLRVAGLLARS